MEELNEKELAKVQCFKILHKCPWYVRIFKKYPKYVYLQDNTSTGLKTSIKCKYCGKTLDVTDYNKW